MRGYFAGLVKQSGLTITPGNRSEPLASPSGRVRLAAPMHVESVLLVEPSTRSFEVSSAPHSPEKSNRDAEVAYRSHDHQFGDEASVKFIRTNLTNPRPGRPSDHSEPRAQPSETEILKRGSSSSLTLEKFVETGHASGRVEEQPVPKGGVIRVGEHTNESRRSESLADLSRLSDSPRPAIPNDYLVGIREWLASSSTHSTDDSSGTKQLTDQSLRSVSANGHRQPQKEIQEFSLSIGSISIVVEEPAEHPVTPPVSTPALNGKSNGAQRQGRDAFALSRNYFRGF
jgi:hypothetical protein